jgi:signal transduction histidine kinase
VSEPGVLGRREEIHYNAGVSKRLLEEILAYVEFSADDARHARSLAEVVRPEIPRIVRRFYEVLLRDPGARAVFTGGEAQIARQNELLAEWLYQLFDGRYDREYFDSRFRIGFTHVRVALPQRYMILGMEILWRATAAVVRDANVPDTETKLQALHKLLMVDLTIMLESYQESYSEAIRTVERDALEAQLVRAEHLAEIGQLAASLAHEIKNPLAGISGAIQIMAESMAETDPHRRIIQEILRQIDRLDSTIKDLLLYARPSHPSVREVKVDSLVQRVLTILREEPALRRVRVEFSARNGDSTLMADEGQLEQVLINLILNAAHASDEGGLIQVRVGREDGMNRITIQDRGHGMKPDVLARALEPFFTTKAKGTGLGLAICRRIVEAHGGAIRLESKYAQGTTVSVDLPCAGARKLAQG